MQTTGSAGESIAFGVGVTMPALLLLGFEMDSVRVMTVSVLGGLLGILMMIPLRRAFIVKQHGKLKYPEGTACAEVLVAGEKGGVDGEDGVRRLRHRVRSQVPDRGVSSSGPASRAEPVHGSGRRRRSASRGRRSAANCRPRCSASAT